MNSQPTLNLGTPTSLDLGTPTVSNAGTVHSYGWPIPAGVYIAIVRYSSKGESGSGGCVYNYQACMLLSSVGIVNSSDNVPITALSWNWLGDEGNGVIFQFALLNTDQGEHPYVPYLKMTVLNDLNDSFTGASINLSLVKFA